MRISLCFALAISMVGCGKSDAPATKPAPGAGSPVMVPPPPVAADGVQLVINDKVVATLSVKDLAAWPRLDALVPQDAKRMGQWEMLTVTGKDGKPVEFPKPGDQYRDQALAVYVADGAASFGIFDPVELAKKGAPATKIDGVKVIKLKVNTEGGRGQNESGSGGGGDPLQIKVAFKTPKGESTVTGEQLLAVPRDIVPGTTDQKGWKLSALLKLGGITKFDKIVVSDATAGLTLAIEQKDFDDINVIPFLKLNKQATLRLKIYKKQGTGWQSSGDIRAVATIEQIK